MDTSNTPNHRNSIPSPPTFAGIVGGNFHGLETILWPLRVYEHDTPLNIPYMDNQGQGQSADSVNVKAEHDTPP